VNQKDDRRERHIRVPVEVEAIAVLLTKRIIRPKEVHLYVRKEVIGNQETEVLVRYLFEDLDDYVCQLIPGTGWIVKYPKLDFSRFFEESWEFKVMSGLIVQEEVAEKIDEGKPGKREHLISQINRDIFKLERNSQN
jgi:hypothetical protein